MDIELSKPFAVTDDIAYGAAMAGVLFYSDRAAPDTRLCNRLSVEPSPALPRRIGTFLPAAFIQDILHLCATPEAEDILKEALQHARLKQQATRHEQDFYFDGRPPATWELRDQCLAEIDLLHQKLQDHGIHEMRAGIELEFSTSEKALPGYTRAEETRARALAELEQQKKLLPAEKRADIEVRIDAVSHFNARELMMYDIITLDPRTRDIMEPLFGTQHDGTGYYDGGDVLELKIAHAPALRAAQNYDTVMRVLIEKHNTYGLLLLDPPSPQVSVSFWDARGNIMETTHPDYDYKAGKITAGITRGLYDALPSLIPAEAVGGELSIDHLNAGFGRDGFLRVSSGRLETRPSSTANDLDVPFIIAINMASALSGLDDKDMPSIYPAEKSGHLSVYNKSDIYGEKHGMLVHLISGSSVSSNTGIIYPPRLYMQLRISYLAYACGLISQPVNSCVRSHFSKPDYADGLTSFLQNMRLKENSDKSSTSLEITFPSDSDGIYRFKSKSERVYEIDTRILSDALICEKAEEKYVVQARYPLNRCDGDLSLRETRMKRFYDALMLKQFSPEFGLAATKVLRDNLGTGIRHKKSSNSFKI